MNSLSGKNGHRKPKQLGPGKKDGRPSTRNEKVVTQILNRIRETASLCQACTEFNTDPATFLGWTRTDEELSKCYAEAKEIRAELMADRIIELTDNCPNEVPDIMKARLQVDTRKFILAKVLPKIYGDKPANINFNPTLNILALPESKLLQLQERHKELLEAV